MITDNQLLHRQYLQSEVWRQKRIEALSFYGAICNRCKRSGSDVHHKTYERAGGGERMEDLEILCRGCHDAHHAAERSCRGRKARRPASINRQSLSRLLTQRHRAILKQEFSLSNGELYLCLIAVEGNEVIQRAETLLGHRSFGGVGNKTINGPSGEVLEAQRKNMVNTLVGVGVKMEYLQRPSFGTLRKWYKRAERGESLVFIFGKKNVVKQPAESSSACGQGIISG